MNDSISKALEIAAALCRRFEGFYSKPYICPAGYPTIGYGTVYRPDGRKVTLDDDPISKELAETWLLSELQHNYMRGVLKASPNLITHPRVLGAITDFAYNLGVARYRASTLKKKIDLENWEEAKTELLKWNKANGKLLKGLDIRRKTEATFLPCD